MGRWSQHDEDECRLPDGMTRVGYDADTEVYTYKDADGNLYEGTAGDKYGMVRPAGYKQRSRAIAVQSAKVRQEEWKNPFHSPDHVNVDEDNESVLSKLIVAPIQSLRRSLTDTIKSATPRRLSDVNPLRAFGNSLQRRATISNGGFTKKSRGHEKIPESPAESTSSAGDWEKMHEQWYGKEKLALCMKPKRSPRRATTSD